MSGQFGGPFLTGLFQAVDPAPALGPLHVSRPTDCQTRVGELLHLDRSMGACDADHGGDAVLCEVKRNIVLHGLCHFGKAVQMKHDAVFDRDIFRG